LPTYSYLAKTTTGTPKTGILEAKDEHELSKILRQEGYILVSAEKEKTGNFARKLKIGIPFLGGKKVSIAEKIMFSRNLKVIISAGISLPRALTALSEQTKNKRFKESLSEITEQISKGKAFSDSLSNYSDIFSELYVSMIKVGEESGTMEQSLEILAKQLERKHELEGKIKGAMIYPLVIVSAMAVIGVLMMIMVVPQLAATFKELEIELPFTTRMVIFIGMILSKFWYLMPVAILALIFLLRFILKTKSGKRFFDASFLKIPFFSSLVMKINSAYMVRTLGSLISAGVPLVRALEITARTLGNTYYRKSMEESAEEMKKGTKLSQFLENFKDIYPSLVIQMIAVGEETGQTSDMLAKLADFYEEEVSRITKNLSVIIEPVLMIIVGIIVGFFVISMIQPMYGMIQTL